MPGFYNLSAKDISGSMVSMDSYKNKVVLVVNVASACGLTDQYEGLSDLYHKYHKDGLEILGFPCNQFGQQEPGSEQEIKEFCQSRFAVPFALFSKIEVNGPNTHPIYSYLKSEMQGASSADIEWNFAKFLLDRNGKVLERFSPKTAPSQMEAAIKEHVLG